MTKLLGMWSTNAPANGYDIDREVTIREMLKDNGLEEGFGVRAPIGEELNEINLMGKKLPINDQNGKIMVKCFKFLL